MKLLFKNEKEEYLSLSLSHKAVLRRLALFNKGRYYQELLFEEIKLAVPEIDSINAFYNCAQKSFLNVNQVGSC